MKDGRGSNKVFFAHYEPGGSGLCQCSGMSPERAALASQWERLRARRLGVLLSRLLTEGSHVGTPPVLPLREDDVDLAGRVIARAFHEDELTVHLYPESDLRARFAPAMFAAFLRYDQLFGQVDHLAGCTAVASWIGPGEAVETPERLAQAGFEDLPDEVPIETLDSVFGFIGPAIAKAAPEPHWHLRLLGVEPGHQGGGLGAVVMRHGIDRAADSGHPVVLETFSERAVPFYLRNGFKILVDDIEPTSNLRFWALHHSPEQ